MSAVKPAARFFFEKHAGELVSNTTPLTPVTEGSISFLKNKIK